MSKVKECLYCGLPLGINEQILNIEYCCAGCQSNASLGASLISKPNKKALDIQEGGTHYKDMKIQPIEFILANNLGFVEGCVVKYVSRYKNKNGIEDLKKAKHFLDILIENYDTTTKSN